MEHFSNQDRPRRREYSQQFKTEILALCAQPGASVGGVALAQGLHSNMVHRWIREQRERQTSATPAFVALPMHAAPSIPAQGTTSAELSAAAGEPLLREVHLRLQRGELLVHLKCPLSQCAALLREILR